MSAHDAVPTNPTEHPMDQPTRTPPRTTRHPFDWWGLLCGLLALAAVSWWVLRETGTARPSLLLVVPIALIVAGLAGLATSVARGARDRRTTPTDPPATPTVDGPDDTDLVDDVDQTKEIR